VDKKSTLPWGKTARVALHHDGELLSPTGGDDIANGAPSGMVEKFALFH
jgi:hypothetical protein